MTPSQAWLQPGNGLMIPEWSYTDENGEVEITFTPNPATAYDLKTDSIINVIDIKHRALARSRQELLH